MCEHLLAKVYEPAAHDDIIVCVICGLAEVTEQDVKTAKINNRYIAAWQLEGFRYFNTYPFIAHVDNRNEHITKWLIDIYYDKTGICVELDTQVPHSTLQIRASYAK